jgi:OmpA-OmpF porin, OOP family
MRKTIWWYTFVILTVIVGMAGCAPRQLSPPPPFTPEPIEGGMWKQKADCLVFVLDASSSMEEAYHGVEKFALARSVVANFNQTMPNLKLQVLVRSFGHDPSVSPLSTMRLYGPAEYSRSGIAQALAKVSRAGGPSPMDKALFQVADDLKGARGPIALIIVSDGKDMGAGPLGAANALKAQFQDRLCIYTVQVGDDPGGRTLLAQLSGVTGCGRALTTDDVASGAGMAAFVKQALLTEQADSDHDGVPDAMDQCPGTPKGVSVDSHGCPKDSDHDGVFDYLDRCPNTPAGERVDSNGCPVSKPTATKSAVVTAGGTWIYKGVQFETNSADLKPSSIPVLDEIAAGLKEQPNLRLEIQGHTDNRGSRRLNARLSQRRAESVRNYLVSKGISGDRLVAKGYGPAKPVASNNTAQGRAENRRVELKPLP